MFICFFGEKKIFETFDFNKRNFRYSIESYAKMYKCYGRFNVWDDVKNEKVFDMIIDKKRVLIEDL